MRVFPVLVVTTWREGCRAVLETPREGETPPVRLPPGATHWLGESALLFSGQPDAVGNPWLFRKFYGIFNVRVK